MFDSEAPATDKGDQFIPSATEAREILLNTKLYIPAIRSDFVKRSRLFAQLDAGMNKALTLISAPAGYGKTTLVGSWLSETKIPSAWISLDEDDNDPARFLQYLFSALQKVIPTVRAEMLTNLKGLQPPMVEGLLNTLSNEISSSGKQLALILDDFHVIHAQGVLDFLALMIGHLPHNMHMMLLSRIDPFLPLAQLRVRDQLVEIRAEQLRFTQDESAIFLREVMALELAAADLASLQTRTEGWIAGIQLAGLSLQQCEDMHAFVTAFAGSHHYIIDYLTEEVLKRQSEEVRNFLLKTSVLKRMCAALCEAVAGSETDEPMDSQAILEDLERRNLFVIPLDDERRWYRYHHLFCDMLSRRLEDQYPDLASELHQRAARWYEQNGYIPETIVHSLEAGEQAHAIQLIEKNGVLLLIRGEVGSLLSWIEAVEPGSAARPWLYIFKAWAYTLSGDLKRVEGMLKTADELIASLEPTQEVNTMLGTMAAARAHGANLSGNPRLAADFARQALKLLPEADLVTRSLRVVSTSLLGDASSLSGDLEEARNAYIESARISQAAGDIHLSIVINSNLANILVEQGNLRQASRIYSDTLSMASLPDGQKALIAGRLYVELSQVQYEWNQVDEAFQYAQKGLKLCQQWGNMDLQAVANTMLAQVEQLQSHLDEANKAAQAAEQLVNSYDLAPRYAIWVRSRLARLSIHQGDLQNANHHIEASGIMMESLSEDGGIPYLYEPIFVSWLQLLLSKKAYDHAIEQSERVLQPAETGKRVGRMIEVLIIQALAFQGKKDMEQALTVLERALVLAQPEGYVRVFLDEGEPMMKLLYQAKAHRVGGSAIAALLSSQSSETSKILPATELLVDPLTRRELELLRLIEAGYTNQEIADRLVISIPTVKRHISNIYLKLGANNRTQAVSLGKELKLLD